MKPGFVAGICGVALAFAVTSAQAAPIVFETSGANAAGIQATVDAFRNALGALNPNDPVNFDGGRRQINWDAAPDAVSDPNPFPGDFFNANFSPRARGIEFSTPGTGFLLSSTAASGQPPRFGFPGVFIPFSEERMFTPIGSTTTFVDFFSPADPDEQAFVRGFGVVFNDVDLDGSTSLELFDQNGDSIFASDVMTGPNSGLSFLGVVFDEGELIAGAEITSGTGVLLSNGTFAPPTGTPRDGVVMDDFIFGEPIPISALEIPEPPSIALLGGAIFCLGIAALRRRKSGQKPSA